MDANENRNLIANHAHVFWLCLMYKGRLAEVAQQLSRSMGCIVPLGPILSSPSPGCQPTSKAAAVCGKDDHLMIAESNMTAEY